MVNSSEYRQAQPKYKQTQEKYSLQTVAGEFIPTVRECEGVDLRVRTNGGVRDADEPASPGGDFRSCAGFWTPAITRV